MSGSLNNNFENLFSIITAFCVFIIIGTFFTLAKQYPPRFVLLDSLTNQSKVEGYKKPGSTKMDASQSEQGKDKIDLLASLPKDKVQLLIQRFEQAASLLHAGQYEYAIKALNQVVQIQPRMPEAYVNLGYAYLGIEDFQTSANSFSRAIDLRPEQVNAYYGLAEALEGMKDYEGALGAMRSYIHLSPPNDPFIQKAQSAIWELETRLGRKPTVEQKDQNMQFDSNRFVSPHNAPPQTTSPHSSSSQPASPQQ
jgi:tetratricopeptide (TPR) repeat protein